jgi:hypothetical protein
MPDNNIEISVKGQWVKVPALDINGKRIIVRGNWLKTAVVHDETWLETELENPELCIKELREKRPHGLKADIFSFTQKLSGTAPKYSYPMEWDSVAAIRLPSFKDWWEKLPQEARKNVRRSQKRGVTIKVKDFDADLIAGISDVNNDSETRQGVRNTYFGKTIDQVRRDYSAFVDRSDFVCAYLGEEMIGFLKIVYRQETASIINLTPKPSHSDKRPANALVAKAVELCDQKGISFITYGLYNYGNKRDSPLREFKIRTGFQEILVPRYYVPLTGLGAVCVKAGLHRGLLGILPNRVITMGVSLRGKWYNFTTRNAGVAQR